MFDWLFRVGKLRRKIERDEIKAIAEDEVWRMRQSAEQLRDAMERSFEHNLRGYMKGKKQ